MKKVLSILLVLSLLVGNLPMAAFAAEETVPTAETTESTEKLSVNSAASAKPSPAAPETVPPTTVDTQPSETVPESSVPETTLETAAETTEARLTSVNAPAEPVKVTFLLNPADLVLSVYKMDGQKRIAVEPAAGHRYDLLPGDYFYDAQCAGYESAVKVPFTVSAEKKVKEIRVALNETVVPETTEAVVPETTETVVPETTEAVVPETTEAVAPETTETVVPETTETVVPETTEAVVPETTEAVVPETTEAVVPETTEAVAPETTEAVVPETTEAVVPETTEEDVPETTEAVVSDSNEAASAVSQQELPCGLVSAYPSVSSVTVPGSLNLLTRFTHPEQVAACQVCYGPVGRPPVAFYSQNYNPDTGLFELPISLNEYISSRQYSIQSLVVTDTQGNTTFCGNGDSKYTSVFENAAFSTVNEHPELADAEPPRLLSVTIDKTDVIVPDSVLFQLDLEENGSGIEKVRIDLYVPGTVSGISLILHQDPESGLYEMRHHLNENSNLGEYYVSGIQLLDKADNLITYGSIRNTHKEPHYLPEEIVFTVKDAETAAQLPVLKSLKFSSSQITVPGDAVLSAEVTSQNAPVEEVKVKMTDTRPDGTEGPATYAVLYLNELTGLYEMQVPLSEYSVSRTMTVERVIITDRESHEVCYVPDTADQASGNPTFPGPVSLTIVNPDPSKEDDQPPKLISIAADSTEITAPGYYKILVDLEEKVSGLREGYVTMADSQNSSKTVTSLLTLNESTGQYEASFYVSRDREISDMVCLSVNLTDNALHQVVYKSNHFGDKPYMPLPQEVMITIKKAAGPQDQQPPELLSIHKDRENLTAPGHVTLTLDIRDDISGFASGKAAICRKLKDGSVKSESHTIYRDPSTFEYVVCLTADEYVPDADVYVSCVTLNDEAGNTSEYYAQADAVEGKNCLPNEISFQIINPNDSLEDLEPPKFVSITADAASVTSPGTVHLTMNATDDASGIHSAEAEYEGEDYDFVRVSFHKNQKTGLLEADMKIPSGMSGQKLTLDTVRLTDKSGKRVEYGGYSGLPLDNKHTLQIAMGGDMTPPVLHTIEVDKTQVTAPGQVKITARASDNASGIKQFQVNFGVKSSSIGGRYSQSVLLTQETGTDMYSGILQIPAFINGAFNLVGIFITDNAGNKVEYNSYVDNLPVQIELQVSHNAENPVDVFPPVLHSVTADRSVVTVPGEVKFCAEITDDVSGITAASLEFRLINAAGERENAYLLDLSKNISTGLFEGTLKLDRYTSSGTLELCGASVDDNAQHYVNYALESTGWDQILPVKLSLPVENPQPAQQDLHAPVLKSVSVENAVITLPGTMKIIADVQDDLSGVAAVNASFNGFTISLIKNESTGFYEGGIRFGENIQSREFKLQTIIVRDHAGNEKIYGNTFPLPDQIKVQLVNNNYENVDHTPPVLHSITADQTYVNVPGQVKFSAKITDDQSDIKSATIRIEGMNEPYNPSYRKTMAVSLEKNPSTGLFEGTLALGKNHKPDQYGVFLVEILDDAGNQYTAGTNQNDSGLENAMFTVVNPNYNPTDHQGPQMVGVSVDQSTIQAPGSVKITVDMLPDESGFLSAYAEVTENVGAYQLEKNHHVDLQLNPDTNQLEGYLSVTKKDVGMTFHVTAVNLYDQAGNQSIYGNSFYYMDRWGAMSYYEDVSFQVTGEEEKPGITPHWEAFGSRWCYVLSDGSYAANNWYFIDGSWYRFDSEGYMVTGWAQIDGSWYYMGSSGKRVSGWLEDGGNTFYFNQNGQMVTGFCRVGAHTYYFNGSGYMLKATWFWDHDKNYYVNENGVLLTDQWIGDSYVGTDGAWDPSRCRAAWLQTDGKWWYRHEDGSCTKADFEIINGNTFYFDGSGYMVTGFQSINNNLYYFDASGYMAHSGWFWAEDHCCYAKPDGTLARNTWIGENYVNANGFWDPNVYKEGWVETNGRLWYRHQDGSCTKGAWEQIGGSWYFFDGSGWMLEGWQFITGSWFYLDHGRMVYGLQNIGGNLYCFDSLGHLYLNGWFWYENNCYYANSSGAIARNTWIGSSYVDASGKWIPGYVEQGWIEENGRWWYRHADGSCTKGAWEQIDGSWYFFDGSGWMLEGWQFITDNWFYLDHGKMVTGFMDIGGNLYYFNGSGYMARSGWFWADGRCYYANSSGYLARNAWIDGSYVGNDGAWDPAA